MLNKIKIEMIHCVPSHTKSRPEFDMSCELSKPKGKQREAGKRVRMSEVRREERVGESFKASREKQTAVNLVSVRKRGVRPSRPAPSEQ